MKSPFTRADAPVVMQSDFFPDTDGEILAWSTNFREYIVADASSLGLSAQQVERYVTCQ